MKRSELIFALILVPLDYLMILIAGIIAYALRFNERVVSVLPLDIALSLEEFVARLLLFAIVILIVFALTGLYRTKVTRSLISEVGHVFISSALVFAGIAMYTFFTRHFFESRFIVIMTWAVGLVLIALGRIIVKKFQQYLVGRYGIGAHHAVLIGSDASNVSLYQEVRRNPRFGYRIIKQYKTINLSHIEALARRDRVDEVFLTRLGYPHDEVLGLVGL